MSSMAERTSPRERFARTTIWCVVCVWGMCVRSFVHGTVGQSGIHSILVSNPPSTIQTKPNQATRCLCVF